MSGNCVAENGPDAVLNVKECVPSQSDFFENLWESLGFLEESLRG